MKRRLPSLFAVGCFVVIFALLFGVALPSAAAQKIPVEEAAEASAAILKRLRKACEDEAPLRGILILKSTDDDKKAAGKKALVLEGFLDKEDQRGILAKRAAEILAFAPWKERYPGGVIVDNLKISPIRTQYLARMKTDFAKRILPNGKDEKEAKILTRLLAQTRLDDAYYHHNGKEWQLMLEGVCLYVDREKGEDGTRERLFQAVTHLLQKEYPPPELKDVTFGVSPSRIQVVNPLSTFQAKFTDALLVTDIFFSDASYAQDGTLLLKGWVGGPDVEKKRKLFEEHFGAHSAVASPKARFSFEGMKGIDWPLDRKKWNHVLAQEIGAEVSKTHIVRIFFDATNPDEPVLHCEAVTFADLQGGKEDALIEQSRPLLLKAWAIAWPETLQLCQQKLQFKPVSRRKIQRMLQTQVVQEFGVKQGLISKIFYDADGVLVIEGTVANEDQRKVVEQFLKSTEWHRWSGGKLSLEGLHVEDWDKKMRFFQAALSGHADLLFKQTRLDDIAFIYPDADSELEMRFKGITFHPQPDDPQEKQFLKLLKEVSEKWPILQGQTISIRDIKTVPPVDRELQDRVRETPALDGVFVAKNLVFNDDGKLVLQGKWRGPHQANDLKNLIGTQFRNKTVQPNLKGVVFDELDKVPTDQLLADLQDWAKTKEDVRIERLYFDSDGKLRVKGSVGSDANVTKVKTELDRLIKLLRLERHRELKIADTNAAAEVNLVSLTDEEADDSDDLSVRPSLAKHLREKVLVPTDPKWDGVLIVRGFYDEKGAYNLVGLVDNAKQIDGIKAVLKDLSKTPEWRVQLDKGWNSDQLQTGLRVMPVQPMLDALRVLSPEFPELDRLRFDRAYHGKDKKLILDGFKTTGAKEDAAANVLAEQLLRHPDWKQRVQASINDPELGEANKPGVGLALTLVPENTGAADLASNRAFALLVNNLPDYVNRSGSIAYYDSGVYMVGCMPVWVIHSREQKPAEPNSKLPPREVLVKCRDYLDVTLFHKPDDTSSWYLRAACYLALKDEENALRNLRRMNEIEIREPSARSQRLAALEMMQGHLRQLTTTLAEKALLQVADGYRVSNLAEVAQVTRKK